VARRGNVPRILPFIRDLNPNVDDFPGLLEVVKKHQGNRKSLATAILRKWKRDGVRHGFDLHSIEANVVTSLGEDNLGIIDDAGNLTKLGNALHRARKRPDVLKRLLGVHLLQHRAGWQFARALSVLSRRGRTPRRNDIAGYLAAKYGIDEWRDMNNISGLHGFLEWCGVVKNYRLNEGEFERLLGAPIADVKVVEGFTIETRTYLQALVRLGGKATAGDAPRC
jgi:hypothetical protein